MGGSGVADLHSDVKEEWALFDKRSYCEMQWKQIFEPYLRINGYKGQCRSIRGGINMAQLSLFARTAQSLFLSGWKIADSEAQKLTNMSGIKFESFDPNEGQGEDGGRTKQDKSKQDKKRYGNPA